MASFLASGLVDDLWIILTPSPPHKHIAELAPFSDRWNMLELAFSGMDTVHLSDIEQRLPSPHYTIRTLTFFKNSYPDRTFYLCIGGDTLQTLSTWFEYEKIAHKSELLVAERPGIPTDIPDELSEFTVHYCDHRPLRVSSTEIRRKLTDGTAPAPGELRPEVLKYVRDNALYGWREDA